MKKLLLALFLGSLLLAVSYYKTTLQDENVTTAYESGRAEGQDDVDQSNQRVDSLREQLSTNYMKLAETQSLADTIRLSQNDSLRALVEKKDLAIADLTSQKQTMIAKKTKQSETSKTKQRHRDILAHYKKLYKNLPSDLTAYETRVALAEIRDLSARKFAISVAELNRIRKVAKLEY